MGVLLQHQTAEAAGAASDSSATNSQTTTPASNKNPEIGEPALSVFCATAKNRAEKAEFCSVPCVQRHSQRHSPAHRDISQSPSHTVHPAALPPGISRLVYTHASHVDIPRGRGQGRRADSFKIMSAEEHAPATIVQSHEARGRGEGGARSATTPPSPGPLPLLSWSASAQQVVVRDTAAVVVWSSKVAPAAECGLEGLRDVESGTAPSTPAVSKAEAYCHQSLEGTTVNPPEKEPPAAEGRASCSGRALLLYSGRLWPL